ncbi:MAG: PRC-barrel domain-containing protein [Pyrinomonadaceae bacterium]
MLQIISDLDGRKIHAADGEIGSVEQFYFDDETWTVRYLVVDTGNWLSGKEVLISPIAVGEIDSVAREFIMSLTKEQVENSPGIETDKPVSRQHEAEYNSYYGYTDYWGGGGLWGLGAYPSGLYTMGYPDRLGVATGYAATPAMGAEEAKPEEEGDPHLRSTKAVTGYNIEAKDGGIGHVEDFIIDDKTWAIRFLVVDTVNWWPGKKVIVAPQWIERVSWDQSKVFVNLTKESIKNAPEYFPSAIVNQAYEESLYNHYGMSKYGY